MPPFAPGLVKRKRNGDEENGNLLQDFRYLKHKHVNSHNGNPDDGDEVDPDRFFNSTGVGFQPDRIVGDVAVPGHISANFKTDDKIMQGEPCSETAFEKANRANLSTVNGTLFVSEIDGQRHTFQLESDVRLLMLDRYGHSTDGRNRGKIKKSRLQEFFRRIEERDKEIIRAVKIYEEWRLLTPEEREQRRMKQRRNVQETQATLEIEEVDETPEMFSRGVVDMVSRVRAWTLAQTYEPESKSHTNIAGSELLFLQDDDQEPFLDTETDRGGITTNSVVDSIAPAPRVHARPGFPHVDPFHGRAKRYQFPEWSRIVPVEENPIVVQMRDIDEEINFAQVKEQSGRNPRVVSLALADEYACFSSAIIVDRIFGGAVQEIQFFPDVRQAVLVFIYPDEARCFLMHINCAAEYSAHEYRRLQIEATWYMGDSSFGILPAQSGILSRVIARNASRTVRIHGIDKLVPKDLLLAAMRAALSELHIVRAKLIKPTLRMHREALMSNSVVLEFASIRQALEAKNKLDAGDVKDFVGHRTEFLQDASRTPKAPAPWCACLNCTTPNELVRGADAATEASWRYVGRASSRRSILDTPAQDTSSEPLSIQASLKDRNYDPEQDAKKLGVASYRHDDVQSSRLQSGASLSVASQGQNWGQILDQLNSNRRL